MYKRILPFFCILFLVAGMTAADLPPESNRMRPDHLPTPFSAEELKAWNVPGYQTTYLVEAEGREPLTVLTQWLPSEGGKGVFVSQEMSSRGELLGKPQKASADWKELQSHASFPVSATQVSTVEIEVPAGKFTCWRYDVERPVPSGEGEPKTLVMSFWFARDLPGPPVLMQHRLEGRVTMTMTLLSHKRPKGGKG